MINTFQDAFNSLKVLLEKQKVLKNGLMQDLLSGKVSIINN